MARDQQSPRYEPSHWRNFVSLVPLLTGVVWWFLLFSVVCAISPLLLTPAVVLPGIVLGLIAPAFLITAVYIGVMSTFMMLGKGNAQSQDKTQPPQSDDPSTDHKWQVLTYLAMLGTGLLLVGLCVGALYVPALAPFTVALFAVGAAMGIHGVGLIVFTAFFAFGVGVLIGLMSSATMYFAHIPVAAFYHKRDRSKESPKRIGSGYVQLLKTELDHARQGVVDSLAAKLAKDAVSTPAYIGRSLLVCADECCLTCEGMDDKPGVKRVWSLSADPHPQTKNAALGSLSVTGRSFTIT